MPSPNAKAKSTTTCKRERSCSPHVSRRSTKISKVSCSIRFSEIEGPIAREMENSAISSQTSQNSFNGGDLSSKECDNEENQMSSDMDTSLGQTCLSSNGNGCMECDNEENQLSSDMETNFGLACLSSNGCTERDNGENQIASNIDTTARETCLPSSGCMELDNEENQTSFNIDTSVGQTCLSSDGSTGPIEEMDLPFSLSSSSEAVLSCFNRPDNGHLHQFEAVSGEQITWAPQLDDNNFANYQIPDVVFDNYVYDSSLAEFFGDEITEFGDYWNYNTLPDLDHAGTNLLYDVPVGTTLFPPLENTIELADYHYGGFSEENSYGGFGEENYCGGLGEENQQMSDSLRFHLMTQAQAMPFMEELDVHSRQFDSEYIDPEIFVRTLLDESNSLPALVSEETSKRKHITLVLDLDETLVHSTKHKCDNADFTIQIRLENVKYPIYVRLRPFLQEFLEKVSEMFEIIVFTASKSIYADQLLDILDPDKKFFSRRLYRESCVFLDGTYTKDLTVLGIDLAKVAIVDNTPEVFRLQADNGIPIKSWYDDPCDSALISLLPFLEKLVDTDDVRPIIAAEKFGTSKQ